MFQFVLTGPSCHQQLDSQFNRNFGFAPVSPQSVIALPL